MSIRGFAVIVVLMSLTAPRAGVAAAPDAATRVDALADRYTNEVRQKFPIRYVESGLPNPRRDILEINAPADLEAWRQIYDSISREAAAIDANTLLGKPQWIALALLKQAIAQDRAIEVCRQHLWSVQGYGWQFFLGQIAELQPVGDVESRKAILARFEKVPGYVAQEIANLRQGAAIGITATRSSTTTVIEQLDALLAAPLMQGAFGSPAKRDADETFRRDWQRVVDTRVRPAFVRYRDFLRNDYLPRARAVPSIRANPNGAACFRARVAANSSVDIDPQELFERASARVESETAEALAAGKRLYGREFVSRRELADALRTDPANRFGNLDELRGFIEKTIARGKASTARVITDPPTTDIEIRRFPVETEADAPSGQYLPRDDDGTRAPLYMYRGDFQDTSPAQLEAIVLHEAWPGHHLQFEVTRAHSKKAGTPLAQLVFIPGVGEGWATYVETLGRELALYESDRGRIGSVMNSMTPRLVADIGMHVMGWDEERAFEYLSDAMPANAPERVRSTVAAIVQEPGLMVPYALGAMEIESMRESSKRKLGEKFDLRRFHRQVIEDGTVPFPALRAKLGLN
jgi:uncharacterized protein (DUF885 family)